MKKHFSTSFTSLSFASLLLSCFLLIVTTSSLAGETKCRNNGGIGYPIPDLGNSSSFINLSLPFNFGDASVLRDLNVQVDIAHKIPGELTLRTTSPESGKQVTIFERPGTPTPEFELTTTGSCGLGVGEDINAIFDDESSNPPVENAPCVSTPALSGDFKPHDPTPDNLSTYDGENPNGNWTIYISDSEFQDEGTLNEICLTAEFAGVVFDKWVSTDPTCSGTNDPTDNLSVSPGTPVYYCYTISNPGDESFTINPGDISDSQGHDLNLLATTYAAGASNTRNIGPLIAGTDIPVGETVNNAQVTATFALPVGQLTTNESATLNVLPPVFDTSTKTVINLNTGSAEPGDVLEYTISINETAGVLTTNLQLDDIVDPNLENITITSLPAGASSSITGNTITVTGIDVPSNGTVTIVFEASIIAGTATGTNIDNTATISHLAFGVNLDIIAPTVVVSVADLSTSTKTVSDLNGLPSLVGETIHYIITINETGGRAASSVTVSDIVDNNLTGVTLIGALPTGAINNTVGNNINISNISIPADGSVSITFEANISSFASIGTIINNTATITEIPTGAITTPSSGSITVGATPTNGNKQLYVGNLAGLSGDLTRVDPGSADATRSITFRLGDVVEINQTPTFQAPFIINSGSTINVLVNFFVRNSSSRAVEVELLNGNTGTSIGSDIKVFGVDDPNPGLIQYLTFQYPISSNITFNTNDFVRLRITNIPVPQGGQTRDRIRVESHSSFGVSQIQMQTNTVINIDSIGVFAAAYPDTTQFPSYEPGSTVFIRTTVSDPFGSADITSSNISITDSVSAVQLNNAAMTEVDTPTGATKVFEFQYTIPASPQGVWRLDIMANEGFEDDVTHSAQSPMIVGTTTIQIGKTSNVISDSVNATNPKTIPGSIVEYTISVENAGFGFADNDTIIINDPLPSNTRLFFGSPINPVSFIDGIIPSGLNFNFTTLSSTTDDVTFSNNGGVSTVTPAVDGSGFDITAPPINHISIHPKGTFKGSSDGSNAPSFEIKLRVRVE